MATAVNEVAATTQEVANDVQLTTDVIQKANELTSRGRGIAMETCNAVRRLSESMSETGATVNRLAQDNNEIGGVVDVIEGIANQANLLAPSAAIGTVWAGDQGRGFVVVADEVRSLAQHTAASTGQTHHLIAKLQNTVNGAVHAIESGPQQAEAGVQRALETDSALVGISEAISDITEMTIQIAAAVEEQSAVVEETNHSISTITVLTEQTSDEVLRTAKPSEKLTTTTQSQYSLVERFSH